MTKLLDLTGKSALVTGGGIGLGRTMALALAEAGADVFVAGRRANLLESAAAAIAALGRRSGWRSVDVQDEAQVKALIDGAIAALGKIDILVNNSGVNARNPVPTQPVEEWRWVMDTNVMGAVYCCRAVGPHMIARRSGRIINIGSVYATHGRDGRLYRNVQWDFAESLPYAASKGAVVQITRDLAGNWGRFGITVNTISPGMFGYFDTQGNPQPIDHLDEFEARTPLGRFGDYDDLKGAVVYLASDAAKFVTGHNLVVDGGWTIW